MSQKLLDLITKNANDPELVNRLVVTLFVNTNKPKKDNFFGVKKDFRIDWLICKIGMKDLKKLEILQIHLILGLMLLMII